MPLMALCHYWMLQLAADPDWLQNGHVVVHVLSLRLVLDAPWAAVTHNVVQRLAAGAAWAAQLYQHDSGRAGAPLSSLAALLNLSA